METAEKPLIAILMAVYEPRMDWLREQLDSLNAQTYPNLQLYVRDDCSPTVPFAEIKACVAACITAFPYTVARNDTNLGSNGTFELLTREAAGEYFAYCDQDDVWLPEKLAMLQKAIAESGALLVCSDMFIMDSTGKKVADSITKIRRHHVFRSGEGLTDTLWYSNFASGCALLVRARLARAALPFNPYMYYDHYITFFSATCGTVLSLPDALLYHREHGENQSSTMQGVTNRESYQRIRVDQKAQGVLWLNEHIQGGDKLCKTLSEGAKWMTARQNYLRGDKSQAKTIWKYRKFAPRVSLFEIVMPYLPDFLLSILIWASKKNLI